MIYFQDEYCTIYHGDCRDVLPSLSGDVVVTDPPYGIGMDKDNAHSSIRDNERWPQSSWDRQRPSKEVFDMILKCSPLVAIWGGNFFADLLPPQACWLAWIKPEAETGFSLADMELCWTNKPAAARIKKFNRPCFRKSHPTQKPVEIMAWTISLMGGGSIIDPFMGSGTTLRAAKDSGLKSVGIEVEERYCEVAVKRLDQGVLIW